MSTNNEDKLILGGHEFTSRFILGSGKFASPPSLARRRARVMICASAFSILQVPEMQKKQFVLPDFPEKSDAVIS